MSMLELIELNFLLNELIRKWYISPNIPSWGAPRLFVKENYGILHLCID